MALRPQIVDFVWVGVPAVHIQFVTVLMLAIVGSSLSEDYSLFHYGHSLKEILPLELCTLGSGSDLSMEHRDPKSMRSA